MPFGDAFITNPHSGVFEIHPDLGIQKPESLRLTPGLPGAPAPCSSVQAALALGRAVLTIPCTGPLVASFGPTGPIASPKRSCRGSRHVRIRLRGDMSNWIRFDIMYHHTWHPPVMLLGYLGSCTTCRRFSPSKLQLP